MRCTQWRWQNRGDKILKVIYGWLRSATPQFTDDCRPILLFVVSGMSVNQRTQHYILAAGAAGLIAVAWWLGLAAYNAVPRPGHPSVPAPQVPSRSVSAKSLSGFTNGFPTSPPATLSQAQINAVRLPKGFVLAQVPWKRDSSQPIPAFVALASLPWADCQVLALHLPHPPQRWGIPDCNFVMALCRDKQGNLWMATEGSGIYRYTPSVPKNKQWTHFTKQNTQGQLANNSIYALACDNKGRIWAGELNHGISVYNGSQWQNYDMVQNPKHNVLAGPLGDHVFALKFDKYTDQMWACTDAGIAIYQCSPTTGYAARAPPSGTAGQPAGINPAARQPVTYNLSPVTFASGTWHYITQADGLPQNPDCIAFGKNGTVYVGTQCAGIAVGKPVDQRTTNNEQRNTLPHITAGAAGGGASGSGTHMGLPYSAPYRWQITSGPLKMPLTPFGQGLPSNLLNAIAIAPNGRVVAGTDGGIAFTTSNPDTSGINNPDIAVGSADGAIHDPAGAAPIAASHWTALHWAFERGQDFPAKVLGLWHPPQHWQAPSPETIESLPMEDYTTAVAVTGDRLQGTGYSDAESVFLWIGHRQRGIDVWQYSKTGKITKRLQIHEPQIGNYVTSLLPLPGGAMAVGTYGHDVSIITLPGAASQWSRSLGGPGPVVSEPYGAAPPTRRQLATLAAQLAETLKTASDKQPAVVALDDDWQTEGSWLGRYGRYWSCLFACCSGPPDLVWSPASITLDHNEQIGPHHRNGDSVRFWVEWLATAKRQVLELPEIYLDSRVLMHLTTWGMDRRESELDDHGEGYPATWQGPGLYASFHIPQGVYTLSLYFLNYNGHYGRLSNRDYSLAMLTKPLPQAAAALPESLSPWANAQATARGRVAAYRSGVWKRFLVRGPLRLVVRVGRNYSLNTMLQAAMLDPLSQHPAPYYYGRRAWLIHERKRAEFRARLAAAWSHGRLAHDQPAGLRDSGPGTAKQLIQILNVLEHRDPAIWAANERLAYLSVLRWCVAGYGAIPKRSAISAVAEKCYYHLGLFHCWEAVEKSRGILTSRQIEKGLRWDRWRDSYRGLEFNTIRKYVKGLKAARKPIAAN